MSIKTASKGMPCVLDIPLRFKSPPRLSLSSMPRFTAQANARPPAKRTYKRNKNNAGRDDARQPRHNIIECLLSSERPKIIPSSRSSIGIDQGFHITAKCFRVKKFFDVLLPIIAVDTIIENPLGHDGYLPAVFRHAIVVVSSQVTMAQFMKEHPFPLKWRKSLPRTHPQRNFPFDLPSIFKNPRTVHAPFFIGYDGDLARIKGSAQYPAPPPTQSAPRCRQSPQAADGAI